MNNPMNLPELHATVPADRSLKQPSMGFCRNPQCRDVSNQEFTFVVEHDRFCCPKCKADRQPMIGLLTMTHLMVPQDGGPIVGTGGLRYRIACDSKRAYLATATNNEAVTDNFQIANCPGCLAVAEKNHVKGPLGHELVLKG